MRTHHCLLVVLGFVAILAAQPAQAALLRHYRLDDNAASTTVLDSTATANATYQNGVNTNARTTTGIVGTGALMLNGTNDWIQIDTGTDLDFPSTLTVSGWVKTNEADGAVFSFRNSDDSLPVVDLVVGTELSAGGLGSGRPAAFFRDDAGVTGHAQSSTVINDGNWHHLAMTRSAAGVDSLYLNGVLLNSVNAGVGGVITTSTSTDFERSIGSERYGVNQGGFQAATLYFGGAVDDFGIWDTAVDEQGIALMNGLGRFSGVDLADPALAAVLGVFNAQSGTALAGSETWTYATGLAGSTGATGGTVGGMDAYIVLNGSLGTGVMMTTPVPEPGTGVLLLIGLTTAGASGWRRNRHR